jgi:hypothetical protein
LVTDDPIIRGEDLISEVAAKGGSGCAVCGHYGFITFSTGGELEPLFLLTNSQIEGKPHGVGVPADAVEGKTVYALTCDNCGHLSLWDAAAFVGRSWGEPS